MCLSSVSYIQPMDHAPLVSAKKALLTLRAFTLYYNPKTKHKSAKGVTRMHDESRLPKNPQMLSTRGMIIICMQCGRANDLRKPERGTQTPVKKWTVSSTAQSSSRGELLSLSVGILVSHHCPRSLIIQYSSQLWFF